MRGGARLGVGDVTPSGLTPFPDGETGECVACGLPADGIPSTPPWSGSFTDWALLASTESTAMCSKCYYIWSENLLARPPADSPGRIFADGTIMALQRGARGLRTLADFSAPERQEPFSAMIGTWMNSSNRWLLAPAAYPAEVFPVLHIARSDAGFDPRIVWIPRSYLSRVVEAADGTPEEMSDTKMRSDWPHLAALVDLRSDHPQASPLVVKAIRQVLLKAERKEQ